MGTDIITIQVNDGHGGTANGTYTVTVDGPLTGVTLSILKATSPMDLNQISPGGITLQATPTGGSTVEYNFQYSLFNATTGAWGPLTEIAGTTYSTSTTCPWHPTKAGDYMLYVYAHEHGASMVYLVQSKKEFVITDE
jgi:hypothetical protein